MKRRTVEVDLSDYRPTPSQRAFLANRSRSVMFSGGYGSGKTRAGAEKALRLAIWNPGVIGFVVSPTYDLMRFTTLKTMLDVIPPGISTYAKTEKTITFTNGAQMVFRSADRPGALEGVNAGWVWVDEGRLITAEAWRTIVGRNRDRSAKVSQILVTTTPAMGWLHDVFGTPVPGVAERIVAKTQENAHNLGPGYVEALQRTFSPRQARALIDGEFTLASGAVFEEWNPARNVVQWAYQPTCRTVLAIDFGVRSPSVILMQITPEFLWPQPDGSTLPARSVVVVDELHPEQTPTVRLVEQIRARWPGLRIDAIYCDPAGSARDQNSGMPSVFTLEHGLGVRPSFSTEAEDRWIPNGIALVQGMLAPVDGPPRLYVSRKVADDRHRRGVVAVMEGFRYPEAKDGRPSSDQPVKDGVLDHAADALRYGCMGIIRDEGRVGPNVRLLRSYAGQR